MFISKKKKKKKKKKKNRSQWLALRLFPLHISKIGLETVVSGRFGLQITLNLRCLLPNGINDASQTLLDGELGHLPLELGEVS